MPNEFDELEPFPSDIRAAFKNYPRPQGDDDFDARFWSELDARQHRYQGFAGFWRRLLEVDIEGVAVWRLGLSLFSGAAFCMLGLALLSLSPSSSYPVAQVTRVAKSDEVPTSAPRFAREVWNDFAPQRQQPLKRPAASNKEISSCASFVHGWA